MRGVADTSAAPRSAWTFVAGATRPRPEEIEAFERSLGERLELGHADGVGFELRWSSGASGGWSFVPSDATAASWWASHLFPLYPPPRWRREPPPPLPPVTGLVGAAGGPPDAPFRGGPLPPWSESLVPGLRSMPSGRSVCWRIVPAGRWPPIETTSPRLERRPPGTGFAPTPPEPAALRDLRNARAGRGDEGRWRVEVEIRGPPGSATATRLARLVEAASRRPGGNFVRFHRRGWWRELLLPPYVLATSELLGLFPTPWSAWHGDGGEGVPGGRRPWLLGRDPSGFPIALPVEEGNGHHVWITGETGMGKSTLLVAMAERAQRLGAVLLLDPLGETADALRGRFVGRLAPGELRVVAPGERAEAGNVLAAPQVDAAGRERAIADLVDALRRVRSSRFESGTFWGPRIEEVLALALGIAADAPGGTLLDALAVLDDPSRSDPASEGRGAGDASGAARARLRRRPEETDGARRVLLEATRSPALRRLLADPAAGWDLRSRFRPGTVTLVRGDAGDVGESTARTLLSVYLAAIWSAVVGRIDRTPVFLFLDEAGWYANDSLGQMLRLGRRWGLHVVLASQSAASFPEELREAVLTNAATQVRFRGSFEEARELERGGIGMPAERSVALPRGTALVLLEKGRSIRWLLTPPPPAPPRTLPHGPGGVEEPSPRSPRTRLIDRIEGHLAAVSEPAVEIPLADLRAGDPEAGGALRALGRELAAAGVSVAVGRGADRRWRIDRVRWRRWVASERAPSGRPGSSGPSTSPTEPPERGGRSAPDWTEEF